MERVGDLDGVSYYDLDDLQAIAAEHVVDDDLDEVAFAHFAQRTSRQCFSIGGVEAPAVSRLTDATAWCGGTGGAYVG